MILSVSRRTDIPAFYTDWFISRLQAGDVLVRNPMRYHQVARLRLSSETIDGIVFWTKNPAPLLNRLDALAAYPYYVQITINPYGENVEANVPSKAADIIPAVQRLADVIGPHRVIWRYDPILLSRTYTVAHHLGYFHYMAQRLKGYTRKCIFGFIDDYKSTRHNADVLAMRPIHGDAMHALAKGMAAAARRAGIALETCCEEIDFSPYGIGQACCVDAGLLSDIGGVPLRADKDRNQRKTCRCATSMDIGVYNTCENGCYYCYANYDEKKIPRNIAAHDPSSPLLVGHLEAGDTVYDRAMPSFADPQLRIG